MIKPQVIKVLIMWITIALVWSALELICYGEAQPRIVDDNMDDELLKALIRKEG